MEVYDYAIIGGGPCGMTLAWILSSQNKKVILIEKEESLGGCHRVKRVDDYFTEHSPRVYSDAFMSFKQILFDMGINFNNIFTEYKVGVSHIDNMTILSLSMKEKIVLIKALFISLFNYNYGKNISMKTFMKENNFTDNSSDYIDRVCRLTDGASSEKYTLFQFLELLNQNLFYKLYQPKHPNDRELFFLWENKLLENNVKILLNSQIINFTVNNNNVSQLSLYNSDLHIIVKANKFILAIPPKSLYSLLKKCNNISNSFGDINMLEKWALNNSYYDYFSLTFHYKKKIILPKINGFPRTPWGIAFIILSNYMNLDDEPSQTIISIGITITDKPNENGKTVNDCSELEIINYVKSQLHIFPEPDKVIISPNMKKYDDKWINTDTAFIVTNENKFLNYKGNINNLFTVGIHNGNSNYHFTTIESAVQNAIYYCKNEYPELKLYYNTPIYLKMRTILFDIVLLGIFFLFIIILKKKIN